MTFKRTLKVFGSKEDNTQFDLWIDDVPQDPFQADIVNNTVGCGLHPNIGSLLFTASPPVKLDGFIKVKIKVNQGSLTLGGQVGVYCNAYTRDESINGKVYIVLNKMVGYDPRCFVRVNGKLFSKDSQDEHLTGVWQYQLTAGDQIEYYHIVFAGPDKFLVDIPEKDVNHFKTVGVNLYGLRFESPGFDVKTPDHFLHVMSLAFDDMNTKHVDI